MARVSIQPIEASKVSFEVILEDIQKAASSHWEDQEIGFKERQWYKNLLGIDGQAPKGFIALEADSVMGFIVYSVEGNQGLLVGLYVQTITDREKIARLLIGATFETLRRDYKVRCIKNIFYTWPEDYISRPFKELGFKVVDRANMIIDLSKRCRISEPSSVHDMHILPLEDGFQKQFEVLLHDSYQDNEDPVYTSQELTWEGTKKRVNELLVDGLHPFSKIILSSNRIVGATIVCVYEKDNDRRFVIQENCVHPSLRKRKIGSALLAHVLSEMQQKGEKKVLLTVTLQNKAAYNLYKKFGFVVQRIIPYAIWTDKSWSDASKDQA